MRLLLQNEWNYSIIKKYFLVIRVQVYNVCQTTCYLYAIIIITQHIKKVYCEIVIFGNMLLHNVIDR